MEDHGRKNPFRLPPHATRSLGLIIGLGLLGLITSRWFGVGIPFTHDGHIHATRIANYYLALKQGQLPPRWGGHLNNGFGYPVFNFNYPLFNILAFPLISLDIPITSVYLILGFVLLQFGFWGMYSWKGMVGAFFYSVNPYIMQLLFVRGSMGELSAYALFPWILWFVTKLQKQTHSFFKFQLGLIVTGFLFLLSHNVMVLILVPLIVGVSVWIFRNNLRDLFRLLIPGMITGLLAAFFWIPALAEKQYTVLDAAAITQGYKAHFINFGALLTGAWDYGFSNPGSVDGLGFFLGGMQLGVMLLAVIALIKYRTRPLFYLVGSMLLLTWCMLPLSKWMWVKIPFLSYIQFPWRLLLPLHIMIALAAAYLSKHLVPRPWLWLVGLSLILFQGWKIAYPIDRLNPSNEDLFYATETTSTLDENMPIWFDKKNYALLETIFKDSYVYSQNLSSRANIERWDGTIHSYTINTKAQGEVWEKSAYFPGWQTFIDGVKIESYPDKADYPGLITYRLPAGEHRIMTRFTESTPARLLGDGLTLMGVLWLILLSGYSVITKKR